jgi:hypothetical protein
VVARRRISIANEEVQGKVGATRFASLTIRVFKLDSLEDRCEDFGQVATYRGSIPHAPHSFALDDHHEFVTNKPMLVCGNTAAMLAQTRFAPHFRVQGNRTRHYGLFSSGAPSDDRPSATDGRCC